MTEKELYEGIEHMLNHKALSKIMTEKELYEGIEQPPTGYPYLRKLIEDLTLRVYTNRLNINDLIMMYSRLLRIKRGYKYFREILNAEIPEDLTKYTTDNIVEYTILGTIKEVLQYLNNGPLDHEEHYEKYMENILYLFEKYETNTIKNFQNHVRHYRESVHNILNHKALNKIMDKAIYEGRMNCDYTLVQETNDRRIQMKESKSKPENGVNSSVKEELEILENTLSGGKDSKDTKLF